MPDLYEACGWVLIAGGACYCSGSLAKLANAMRRGTRPHALPVQTWSGLFLGVVCLACGVCWLDRSRWNWLVWIDLPLFFTYLVIVVVARTMSRKEARPQSGRKTFLTHRKPR
jgi:hypothetical protein